jgi:uncharacterized protein YbjT (DUF2867 family)
VRILLLGASGFIGSSAAGRLLADGHQIVGVSRSRPHSTAIEHIQLDISTIRNPVDWIPFLAGVSAVIDCAGTLQDGPMQSTEGVHSRGFAALVRACEVAGVRRLIRVSAIGIDRQAPTEFSRSKLEGDRCLMESRLDWVILRPSVVVGRSAYGGGALMRGVASLPILPVFPDTGPLDLVLLDDVVETIAYFASESSPAHRVLEICGPRRWSFEDAVIQFREWLSWRPPRQIAIPAWAGALIYRAGDLLGQLGWKPPVRTTAQTEIRRGAIGDYSEWQQITGIRPRDITEWMRREPSSVQERWFAPLYILKPLLVGVLAFYWITTGAVSLGPGWEKGIALLHSGHLPDTAAAPIVALGGVADILIGFAMLYRRTAALGLYAAICASTLYVVVGTALVPSLWADPLGPLLKVFPIVLLNVVVITILPDR